MIEIVVQELTPLHHHVADPIVRCDVASGDEGGRHETRGGLRITVIPSSFLPADWRRETILVDRSQYSSEARVRRAPSRMAQIVAAAVYASIFPMEASVAAVLSTSMTGASGQSFDLPHLIGRQDVLVTKVSGDVCLSAGIHHTSNVDESSLEELGWSGGRATDRVRKSCQPKWINLVFGRAVGIKERRQRFINGTIDLFGGTLKSSYDERRIRCTELPNAHQSIGGCASVIVYSRALVPVRERERERGVKNIIAIILHGT